MKVNADTLSRSGINITANLIPAILFLVACALCFLWNMSDKNADDIRARLIARHEQENKAE